MSCIPKPWLAIAARERWLAEHPPVAAAVTNVAVTNVAVANVAVAENDNDATPDDQPDVTPS